MISFCGTFLDGDVYDEIFTSQSIYLLFFRGHFGRMVGFTIRVTGQAL